MPFWEKPLAALSATEWEQLCDGCGRCCLKKLASDSSDEIVYTRVVCKYFRETDSRCSCYSKRHELVPDCLIVKDMDSHDRHWMPSTCAYRLRQEGQPLFAWHPLIAGSRQAMQDAGISIKGKVLSEDYVHADGLEEHIVRWVHA